MTRHAFDGSTRARESFTLENRGVTVVDELEGTFEALRVMYPMLVFDGAEETRVALRGNSVELTLGDGRSRFVVFEPGGASLQRTGMRLAHRNGEVQAAFADVAGRRIGYRIDVPPG